ncbi:MAG: WYL domain-containing protein [Clostridia bacterium]|nr:WYL domain-containing protein [Clostridia bacterium]
MASSSNKKLLLFYVLEILKKYTDENHMLTRDEIGKLVESEFGMYCERKTSVANIEALEELGYEIGKEKGKGYHLITRDFTKGEILFLLDAIFSSKVIPYKQAEELSKKLLSFFSKYENKDFNFIYKSSQISRTNLNQIFYTIERISEAIKDKKKISFTYQRNSFNKNVSEKTHIVSPYAMVNSQGKYYLVCNKDGLNDLTNFKIEKIIKIAILNEKSCPVENFEGYEKGFDVSKYTNENIYMFGGKTVSATLKIEDEYIVDYVYDWFDKNSTLIRKKDGVIYADVVVNESALVYWALQYGAGVEVLQPLSTREKIAKIVSSMNNKYNNK